MPVVQGIATDVIGNGGNGAKLVIVKIELVGTINGIATPVVGYTGAREIVLPTILIASFSGAWTATLPDNGSLTPSNTYYRVTESNGDTTAVFYIQVPTGGGPYQPSGILVQPTAVTPPIIAGGGGGSVTSVNAKTGIVVLSAADVGADASGAAAAAQAASQPVDADLTAIALLATTSFGRALLALVDAAAMRTAAGLGTAATQASSAFDAAGTAAAGDAAEVTERNIAITNAINALVAGAPGALDTLLEISNQLATDESAVAALVTTVSGKQAADADLTTIAALDSTTAGALVTDGAGWIRKTYAQLKTALGLVKADVGLSNVDNTSDANKPYDHTISGLTATLVKTAIDELAAGTEMSALPAASLPLSLTDTFPIVQGTTIGQAALGDVLSKQSVNVQEFTTSGTWTKPANATLVLVEAISAGGGGCGGSRRAAATLRIGGGGGAGGNSVRHWFIASDLGATETITVGAAGTGGAGASVDSTAGADGIAGGDITIGSKLTVKGGLPGWNNSGFVPGSGGTTGASEMSAGYGGTCTLALAFGSTTLTALGGNGITGGGGAAGSISAADATQGGIAGGIGLGGVGGTANVGVAGGVGTSGTKMRGGGGGGGGASRKDGVAAAYAGGAGGSPGGGGGGGGASLNGQAGGVGGAGGTGYVRVTTFFGP